MLEHHPHRTLTHLVGIPPDPLALWHNSILSRPGAVTEPGAIQVAGHGPGGLGHPGIC
jgi:hypothetical protein